MHRSGQTPPGRPGQLERSRPLLLEKEGLIRIAKVLSPSFKQGGLIRQRAVDVVCNVALAIRREWCVGSSGLRKPCAGNTPQRGKGDSCDFYLGVEKISLPRSTAVLISLL